LAAVFLANPVSQIRGCAVRKNYQAGFSFSRAPEIAAPIIFSQK